jgi:outer membrane cobalamin receptor
MFRGREAYDKDVMRFRINTAARYRINRDVLLAFGIQAFNDYGRSRIDSLVFDINDSNRVQFRNQAGFGELTWKTYWFNIIAGGRIEYNSVYGAAVVPRFALTKNFEKISIKLLTNKSFKAPTLENLNLQDANGLKPELTSVFELELGYKIGRKSYFTLNGFYNDQRNTILYLFNQDDGLEYYSNGGRLSNYGTEAEFIYRDSLWNIRTSWSWYSFKNGLMPELYTIPDNESLVLNFPQHKFATTITRTLPKDWHINLTSQFISARYLYTGVDSQGNYGISKCPPNVMLSFCVNKINMLPGFDFSLAVHNILNSKYVMGQPYAGDLAPVRSLSREAVIRLTWYPGYTK